MDATDHSSLIEQRGEALIRTSVKPGSESKQMKEVFAHGFQTVVWNRLDDSDSPQVDSYFTTEDDQQYPPRVSLLMVISN